MQAQSFRSTCATSNRSVHFIELVRSQIVDSREFRNPHPEAAPTARATKAAAGLLGSKRRSTATKCLVSGEALHPTKSAQPIANESSNITRTESSLAAVNPAADDVAGGRGESQAHQTDAQRLKSIVELAGTDIEGSRQTTKGCAVGCFLGASGSSVPFLV